MEQRINYHLRNKIEEEKPMKKKILLIFILLIMLLIWMVPVLAIQVGTKGDTYEIQLTMKNKQPSYQLYLLLPRDYLEYVIAQKGLDLVYEGPDTLIEHEIPGISVSRDKVQAQEYVEDQKQYVSILLTPDDKEMFYFTVVSSYPNQDIKFRYVNGEKDFIVHLDDFRVQDGVCQIEYDGKQDTVKNVYTTKGKIEWWQILIVVLLVVFISYVTKQKIKK